MQSYWIWSYGDFEIYHSNMANSRREAEGASYPSRWRFSDIERNVKFFGDVDADKDGYFILHLNGIGKILLDGKIKKPNERIEIAKGKHELRIDVINLNGLPAAYIESDVIATDEKWYTKDGKCNKIPVGFNAAYKLPQDNPEKFFFSYERVDYVSREWIGDGVLFDFGKELFGYLYITDARETDKLHVSYGETKEEAIDIENANVFDDVSGQESYKLTQRAFRYIYITGNIEVEVAMDYEYLPLEYKGRFECNDERVNMVYNACSYTMHLCTREVLLDGIKRDRMCWGGDAYQAYKFANYLFFDKEIVKRSTLGLRGRGEVVEHINTITDYSLYWIIGLWEYYFTFRDLDFIKFIYDRAVSLMDFIKTREDENGLIVKKYDDWIFIDWSDIDKTDPVCAEQMLYIEANRAMAKLCGILGKDGSCYSHKAERLVRTVNRKYWDRKQGAFIDSFTSGKRNVTRHANIFAIMYDIATEKQKQEIVGNVLFNDDITKITTPYFEGYELDVMGKLGKNEYFEEMLISYWYAMLEHGATTIWEEFNPKERGEEHYHMYGLKFAKSLCHAWGAGPIYLLGRYYLGVYPTEAGYEKFEVKPNLGHFEFIDGTVPVEGGEVRVYLSKEKLEVTATRNGGTLLWQDRKYQLEANKTLTINL